MLAFLRLGARETIQLAVGLTEKPVNSVGSE